MKKQANERDYGNSHTGRQLPVPFLTKYPIKWLQPLGNCISLAKHQKPTITGRLDIETIY